MRPKAPLPPGETTNVIYRIQCNSCEANYIGETGKRLQTRVGEHMRAVRRMDPLSLMAEHCADSRHTFASQHVKILGRGSDRIARETIEAWHTGTTSINPCVALPAAYQALPAQLSKQMSRREPRLNMNPDMSESMADALATPLGQDHLSQVAMDTLDTGHTFAWDRTRIVGACPFKKGREFLEAMHSDESCINRHIDLDAAYKSLKEKWKRLEPIGTE
ncbi:hypothetical protein SprV_0401709200 [Sparganum proliferum]